METLKINLMELRECPLEVALPLEENGAERVVKVMFPSREQEDTLSELQEKVRATSDFKVIGDLCDQIAKIYLPELTDEDLKRLTRREVEQVIAIVRMRLVKHLNDFFQKYGLNESQPKMTDAQKQN